MSRNRLSTDCGFCGHSIEMIEAPRPIREEEVGPYFSEYRTMQVADAECPACKSKYIAWCEPPVQGVHEGRPTDPYSDGEFFDTSFRSTFNDEFGEADKPEYAVQIKYERTGPWED